MGRLGVTEHTQSVLLIVTAELEQQWKQREPEVVGLLFVSVVDPPNLQLMSDCVALGANRISFWWTFRICRERMRDEENVKQENSKLVDSFHK
jgi:hypothetical protein